MAKKAEKSVKNAASADKKKQVSNKNAGLPRKDNVKSAENSYIIPVPLSDDGIDQQRVDLLPQGLLEDTIEGITSLMEDFRDVSENNMNALQRRRKIGAGIRNYGFIEKVADLAEASPQFAQFFRPADLRNCVINFDMCREIAILLQTFTRLVTNTMLVYSDEAFRMSLIFYNMVKEMSRRGNPTAMELFRTLQPFFKRTRRAPAEPTEKETERELRALLHGTKDGKIVVENIKPRLTGGVHKVIEDVHSDRSVIKESVNAEKKDS